jgi:Na+-transporting methylmalonyl-CoA/oxaloacetate decarboxylase beta subunit
MKTILSSADIGIIGGADGPTAVFVAKTGFPWLLPLIACLLLAVAYLAMRRAARKKAHSFTELPEGYREIYTVDLQKNKKMMLCLNGMALLIALVMAIPAALLVPISTLFSME